MQKFGEELTWAENLGPADWLLERISLLDGDVVSLVPAGFAAYARVLHPAYREEPTTSGLLTARPALSPVSWAEIADRNGKVVHPEVQFEFLVGQARDQECGGNGQPGLWDEEPKKGNLPPDLAAKLAKVLGRHTATPELCWFAVWHGRAEFRSIRELTFDLPGRNYFLFQGPCRAASRFFTDSTYHRYLSANMWWPDDHAWFVATEIDLNSTYIGGTELCMGELLTEPGLEVLKVEASHGITFYSDHINNSPPISAE